MPDDSVARAKSLPTCTMEELATVSPGSLKSTRLYLVCLKRLPEEPLNLTGLSPGGIYVKRSSTPYVDPGWIKRWSQGQVAIRVYSSDLYVELAIKYRAGAYPRNAALARVRRYLPCCAEYANHCRGGDCIKNCPSTMLSATML